MKSANLKQNIEDTIKEWQVKIGYQEESIGLYYPAQTLAELLETDTDSEEELKKALTCFVKETQSSLGQIRISHKGERYCLEIPKEGCRYVAEHIPDPELLCGLLKLLADPDRSMDKIRELFGAYAEAHRGSCTEKDETEKGLGHVFYFQGEETDPYVYCIEEDGFGITYHRFTMQDYRKLQKEGHHH